MTTWHCLLHWQGCVRGWPCVIRVMRRMKQSLRACSGEYVTTAEWRLLHGRRGVVASVKGVREMAETGEFVGEIVGVLYAATNQRFSSIHLVNKISSLTATSAVA